MFAAERIIEFKIIGGVTVVTIEIPSARQMNAAGNWGAIGPGHRKRACWGLIFAVRKSPVSRTLNC
jgi:hypothetical protein